MIMLSKRIAQIISLLVFFILIMVGIFSKEQFSLIHLPIIVLKAFIGYVIFWLLGLVISDIVLKAITGAVENQKFEEWEGGMLSRFTPEKNEELKKVNVERN